jgi:hypothetical protein
MNVLKNSHSREFCQNWRTFGLTVPERLTETQPMKRDTPHGNSAMKLMGIGRRSVSVLVAVMGLCVAASAAAQYDDTLSDGQINRGSASVFTLLTSSSDWIRGGSVVQGDIGIDQGKFTLSGESDVFGDLVYHTGVVIKTSGGTVHGRTYSDDPLIDSALMDAQMLSDAAFAEPVTPRYATLTSVNLSHNSLTITGGANEKVVLRLTDFILTDNSIFTLSGTATTSFIVNVTDTFSLRSNSHISLVNVPASNVLFNIRGSGTVLLRGGSTMPGTLLALNRNVRIRGGSQVVGTVIANKVKITKHSSVLTPTTNQ